MCEKLYSLQGAFPHIISLNPAGLVLLLSLLLPQVHTLLLITDKDPEAQRG